MTFWSLLQLAVKWRLAACRNNKVHLTRLLPAETSCVSVLAMSLTCQKYWTSKHCPFFLSACCALLSLISWQEVGSQHVPIREQRFCSKVFSPNLKTVSAYCYGSSISIPLLLSSDLKSIFQPAHTSREDMLIRTFSPHFTGQNHQIVQTSKKANYLKIFQKWPAKNIISYMPWTEKCFKWVISFHLKWHHWQILTLD